MMTDQFDDVLSNDEDDDRQLRQFLCGLSPDDLPGGIETQVLARIRRQRLVTRMLSAGAAVAVIAVVGLSARWKQGQDVQVAEVPHATIPGSQDLLDSNLIPASLATPPPVVRLGVVAENQSAMLEYLKTLQGED